MPKTGYVPALALVSVFVLTDGEDYIAVTADRLGLGLFRSREEALSILTRPGCKSGMVAVQMVVGLGHGKPPFVFQGWVAAVPKGPFVMDDDGRDTCALPMFRTEEDCEGHIVAYDLGARGAKPYAVTVYQAGRFVSNEAEPKH